jgi:hypothetical protein
LQENNTRQSGQTKQASNNTTPLPAAKEQGLVLKISAIGDRKVFLLNRSDNVPENWKRVVVIATLGQKEFTGRKHRWPIQSNQWSYTCQRTSFRHIKYYCI